MFNQDKTIKSISEYVIDILYNPLQIDTSCL